MDENFIHFENVRKDYKAGEVTVTALHDVSFSIGRAEICVIVGESGAGKTTLLNILGGMDSLSEGRVTVDGVDISAFDKKQLTAYRRTDVGFVFQFYNLIPNLTALENVEIAAQLSKDSLDPATVLEQVGLGERGKNFPAQLSGGEQQRVAIARALAKNPKLLLCRRAGLPDRQGDIEAPSGHLPQQRHDRGHHNAQQSVVRDGRSGRAYQERHGAVGREERAGSPG